MTLTRAQRLDRLRRKKRAQVLVVGGGINGIATWRDLALNGVDVVLVERVDFMSGASSAPSRMIHGGLRYMENGEFELVRESLGERNLLLANAPHLITPLPTLIPITSRFSGIWAAARRFLGGNVAPGERGALIVKIGLTLYDLYAGRSTGMPRHRFFGRAETRQRWPELRPDVVAGAVYYDAKISQPERLGIEMIIEGEEGDSALALNYVALTLLTDGGALLEDKLTGETIQLDADIVVNASGAWIDLTNAAVTENAPQLIGGTKGSHIVIDNDRLRKALGKEMVYFANSEGRVCVMFNHLGNVLAGSTDISVSSPEGIRCEPAEVDYILASIREVFPNISIGEDEIVYRFAGVRPLPNSAGKMNANISRDHSCEWLEESAGSARPVLNLVGGKWTTFRAFGEQAADKVLARLGKGRRTSTANLKIGGGNGYPFSQAWGSGRTLLARYGTRADELPDQASASLDSLPAYSSDEIEWLIENEHVVRLADLVLRRLTIAFSGELSLAAIEELSQVAARRLAWDEARRRAEVADLLDQLETNHGLSAARLEARNPDWKEDDVRRPQSPHEPPVRQRQMS
ncbi:MAG: glycerol-3-phosphate dehydrogenase/oxidase [Rhizobiaceae bacterium]